jgi:hypothetical protein
MSYIDGFLLAILASSSGFAFTKIMNFMRCSGGFAQSSLGADASRRDSSVGCSISV